MESFLRKQSGICHTEEVIRVSAGEIVTLTVTEPTTEREPCTTTVVKIVLSEVMKFAVAADDRGRDVDSNAAVEVTIMKLDVRIVVVSKSPKELVLLTATVGVVEPLAVAEGFFSICIYPKSPLPVFPQVSYGYPGHFSLHESVEVVSPGAIFEHQHDFPCRIANAYLPTQVARHAPLDWKSVNTGQITSAFSSLAHGHWDRITTYPVRS
jgi:hypothetical protein